MAEAVRAKEMICRREGEDMKRILAAVQTDAKVQSKKMECEEQENQTVKDFTE